MTLQATIAATMVGVQPSNIANWVVAAVYGRRLSVEEESASRLLMATQNANISLSYTVNSYTGANYSTLTYQLNSAIASGQFNEYLGGYAQLYNASALEGATSTAAYTVQTGVSSGGSSSSSSGLSGGAIAGIVIAVIFIMAIIGYAVYVSAGRGASSGGEATQNATQVDDTVNPISNKGSNSAYSKQSAASKGAKKPDVGASVGDDNM
jgi:hypothetical protein